ncbi:O-antigen ligase family protein [Alicyclobacillus sp. ALC3]|uniref:O-antigen ligase family protein n=1 Tax=Alicyclobacillus sp. ALC3 TaxID=2796143 RepID=UPI002378B62A|nr:O-antigen ligase family protein [Alicyclobacillus sp. ALC3]WDL97376.1 O-antigen ligase family protein [Alicyclobacillus sp. ALC3]
MDGQSAMASALNRPDVASIAENRWVRWSVYGLVAFPLVDYALRLHGDPLGAIWDKVVLIILAVVALSRFLAGVRPKQFPWTKFAVVFLLYGLALLFAGLNQPVIALEGYRMDVYYILFPLLLPFLVAAEDVPRLLHVAVIVAILIAFDGVYQYAVATPIPPTWADVNEHVRSRAFSVFGSPNELGAYMAMMTPFIAGMAWSERNRWRKILYSIGVLLCIATLGFTFTRGAWMALAVAMVVMAVLVDRRLLFALVVLGVVGFFLPPIHHRIADLFSPVYILKASQGGRIIRWAQAFSVMSGNPLFGTGLGKYGGAVASDYNLSLYSDNYYAKILGEMGIVGLTLFLTMQLALVRDLFRSVVRKAPKPYRFAAIGLVTGLVAVLVHNSIENVFEDARMASIYFVYAMLLLIWSRSFDKGGLTDEV